MASLLRSYSFLRTLVTFNNVDYTQQPHAGNLIITFEISGVIGDWKNHFTVAQNERFDAMLEEEMRDSDLEFVFES